MKYLSKNQTVKEFNDTLKDGLEHGVILSDIKDLSLITELCANLVLYLKSNLTAEELFNKYDETFKSKDIKVVIRYIDSWGHLWKGKCAWPRKEKFIEYLRERLND